MDDGAAAKRKGGKHGSAKPNAEAKKKEVRYDEPLKDGLQSEHLIVARNTDR